MGVLFGNRIGKAGHHGIARTLNAFYIDRNRFRIPCGFRCDEQCALFTQRDCTVGDVMLHEDLTIERTIQKLRDYLKNLEDKMEELL